MRWWGHHIESYKAELAFDMEQEMIAGTATITFQAFFFFGRRFRRSPSTPAADLAVTKVERAEDGRRSSRPRTRILAPSSTWLSTTHRSSGGDQRVCHRGDHIHSETPDGMFFYPKAGKLLH